MAFGLFRALMPDRATHQRNAPTKDAVGGDVSVWSDVAANKRCAVWPTDSVPEMAAAFARRDIVTTHILCFEEDLGAKSADRFVVDGLYYVVAGVERFQNTGIKASPFYLVAANLRTV